MQGGCCESRCFNAPHNWQLGWSLPLAKLNNSNFPPGKFVDYYLPAQHTTDTNIIMLVPDWLPTYGFSRRYAFFLSYR